MASLSYCIMPCAFSNIINQVLLTCGAFSDEPFVKEGSEELWDFRSVSDWLTSGTNSFCSNDDGQEIGQTFRGIMTDLKQWFWLPSRFSPDRGRHCERRACSAGPACLGWCWTWVQCCWGNHQVPPVTRDELLCEHFKKANRWKYRTMQGTSFLLKSQHVI